MAKAGGGRNKLKGRVLGEGFAPWMREVGEDFVRHGGGTNVSPMASLVSPSVGITVSE